MKEIPVINSPDVNEMFESDLANPKQEFLEIELSKFLPILGCIFKATIALVILYCIYAVSTKVISYLHIRESAAFIYTILIIPIIFAIHKYYPHLFKSIFTRFAMSDEMLIYKKGIATGKVKRVFYLDMLHVDSEIYFWSKYFNYATIIITTAGEYIAVDFVKNYAGVEKVLKDKMEEIKMAKLAALNLQEKSAIEQCPDSVPQP